MAVGKNKRLSKKGKARNRRRADAFEKKRWFRLKMPKIQGIKVDNYGWICANRTAQGKTVESHLYDRVCTIRCGDLQAEPQPDNNDHLNTTINLKLRIALTEGKQCFLDFYGYELTRDRTCSMMKKWVSLIEAHVDIKTTDNYVFRVFAMALTKKQDGQCKKTSYAKTSQVKRIRNRMIEIMQNELADKGTKEFVGRLLVDKCGDAFKKELSFIFPIKDGGACIRKVKLIKRPGQGTLGDCNKEDKRRIKEVLHAESAMDLNEEEEMN